MRKLKRQIEHIDEFLEALEEMIDARDDMWEEEKYSNYRQVIDIKEKRYLPAKKKVKNSLERVVSELING
jgi:hypothetical protein